MGNETENLEQLDPALVSAIDKLHTPGQGEDAWTEEERTAYDAWKASPERAQRVAAAQDASKPTVADAGAKLVLDIAVELVWDGEHSYIVAGEHGHPRCFAVRSKAFRRWAISKLRGHGDRVPQNHQQWAAIYDLIDSRAEENGTKETPSIRVAGRDETIYIDLGDDAWNCVKIWRDGWSVEPHPIGGPYFYRPQRMAALPMPDITSVERLHFFLNAIEPEEQMLLTAWLVQACWPRGPYPILTTHGSAGTAKTTRSSVAKALTDPTLSSVDTPAVTSPRKPPKDERSIIAAARNSRVVAFDNVSYLDQWLSDALCRLATGAELGDRSLYSDFDESIFTASRPIILNGIPDIAGQPDLADRCVQTRSRKPAQRMSEATFWKAFRDEWPQLLGVVFDLVAAALRHGAAGSQAVAATGLDVRMSSFARIGEAIGVELGWQPGEFTRAYADNLTRAAEEIAQNDVIFEPLMAVGRNAPGGSWTGTMGELLTALNEAAGLLNTSGKEWPKTARALSNRLARLGPALEQKGIVVGETYRTHGRTLLDVTWKCTLDVHPDVHPDQAENE